MTPKTRAELKAILSDVRELINDARRREVSDITESIHSLALAVGHLVMVLEEMLEKTP